MKTEILMPSLSPTMEEGSLAKWYVSPGDKVKPGDIIADIETDKALMEYESIEEGTIVDLVVKEGTENIKVNSNLIREGLTDYNIPYLKNDSHIIPIHLYEPELCKKAANTLIEEHGIYIQPIFYPTVPKGDERFRVTITPKHSSVDVKSFVESLDKVWKDLGLKRAEKATRKEINKVSKIY